MAGQEYGRISSYIDADLPVVRNSFLSRPTRQFCVETDTHLCGVGGHVIRIHHTKISACRRIADKVGFLCSHYMECVSIAREAWTGGQFSAERKSCRSCSLCPFGQPACNPRSLFFCDTKRCAVRLAPEQAFQFRRLLGLLQFLEVGRGRVDG